MKESPVRRLWTIVIACVVMGALGARPVLASSSAEKEIRFANKVKTGIAKLGASRDSRVEVKLRDKTRFKGFISEINEDGFVVTDVKTGLSRRISYADVKQIKGNNMLTGAKIALGVGIGVAVLIIIALIAANSWGD